jgi:hypothetical protein
MVSGCGASGDSAAFMRRVPPSECAQSALPKRPRIPSERRVSTGERRPPANRCAAPGPPRGRAHYVRLRESGGGSTEFRTSLIDGCSVAFLLMPDCSGRHLPQEDRSD